MKVSIKEAIKKISRIEKEIEELEDTEQQESYVVYNEGENIVSDYSFDEFSKKIIDLQDLIRHIKHQINKANINVLTEYKDLTISEALVLLAQKNKYQIRLNNLTRYKQETRINVYENIEYTKRMYDVKKVKELAILNMEEIHKLQNAIDKANIMNEIEI